MNGELSKREEWKKQANLEVRDGVYHALVRLPGQSAAIRIALHGVNTLAQAFIALAALGQISGLPYAEILLSLS